VASIAIHQARANVISTFPQFAKMRKMVTINFWSMAIRFIKPLSTLQPFAKKHNIRAGELPKPENKLAPPTFGFFR
jgi:hypothetical protein